MANVALSPYRAAQERERKQLLNVYKIQCPNCGHHVLNLEPTQVQGQGGGYHRQGQSAAPTTGWANCPTCNPEGKGCTMHNNCKGRRKTQFPNCWNCSNDLKAAASGVHPQGQAPPPVAPPQEPPQSVDDLPW